MAQHLAPALKGRDALDLAGRLAAMDRVIFGDSSIKSAFDTALHDIAAQHAGRPIYELLGGGGLAALPPGVPVFNKIGQAYGFLIDNTSAEDPARHIEFLLSAVIYVNADGVLNDDKYEYDSIGLPFLRDLGRWALRLMKKEQ